MESCFERINFTIEVRRNPTALAMILVGYGFGQNCQKKPWISCPGSLNVVRNFLVAVPAAAVAFGASAFGCSFKVYLGRPEADWRPARGSLNLG
jgi:hypothetical protein